MERTLEKNERGYKNLIAVAAILEAQSEHDAKYVVKTVYFDFGQNWLWTTICREGYRECQVLSPKQWGMVVDALSIADLAKAAEDIKADQYFND